MSGQTVSTMMSGIGLGLPRTSTTTHDMQLVLAAPDPRHDTANSQLSGSAVVAQNSTDVQSSWALQIARIPEEERKRFMAAPDIALYVGQLFHEIERQGESSPAFRVVSRLQPLFNAINQYSVLWQDAATNFFPPAKIITGAIGCLISYSSRVSKHPETMAMYLDTMINDLDRLHRYQDDYSENPKLQKWLMEIYGDILEFCNQALKYFLNRKGELRKSRSPRVYISAMFRSVEEEFESIITKYNHDLKEFEKEADHDDRHGQKLVQQALVIMNGKLDQLQESKQDPQHEFGERIALVERKESWKPEADQQSMRLMPSSVGQNDAVYDETHAKTKRKILEWLDAIDFNSEQERNHNERLPGTGDWLMKNEVFEAWRTSPTSQLLHIHGAASCGKSFLAARVIDDLGQALPSDNDVSEATAIAYIYCNKLERKKSDRLELTKSIVVQLQQQTMKVDPLLEKAFNRQRKPTIGEAEDSVRTLLQTFSEAYLIVDGLDECQEQGDDEFKRFCQFLASLSIPIDNSNSVIKVLALSRPDYKTIDDTFGECARIQIDDGRNNDDIKIFISQKLTADGLHVAENEDLFTEVEDFLLSKASGVFLWVKFLIESLQGEETVRDIRKALKDAPETLYGIYEERIKQILFIKKKSIRERTIKVLLWTANAKRPLAEDELREALAIEPGTKEIDQDVRLRKDITFAADCKDLIVRKDGCYHLLHSSLKDFLTSLQHEKPHPLYEIRELQSKFEVIMGETCLTYLMFGAFEAGPKDDRGELVALLHDHPFLAYAATFWGDHVADAKVDSLTAMTKELLYSDPCRELSVQIRMANGSTEVCPYPGKTTPLHLLSTFNLVELSKSLPDTASMKNHLDGFSLLPLDHALRHGNREMCEWLTESLDEYIENREAILLSPFARLWIAAFHGWENLIRPIHALGHDVNEKVGDVGVTPLHAVAASNSEKTLKTLLDLGADVNVKNENGESPLVAAADLNRPRLVELLIEAGADVRSADQSGYTALHHVVRDGHEHTALRLIMEGADVNAIAERGLSPVHIAVEVNAVSVLKLLISRGVELEEGLNGWTPLLTAVHFGSTACVRVLIEAKVRLEACASEELTVFHVAALQNRVEILKILLQQRFESDLFDIGDDSGETPLHTALELGHKEIAEILLEKGADIRKTNKKGHSAIHFAVIEGSVEIAKVLVQSYKADVHQLGVMDATPLHYAAHYGHHDLIPLLLQAEVDLEAIDENKDTPLLFATKSNKLEFIKRLHARYPHLNLTHQNKFGYTILHYAAEKGYSKLVEWIVRHEASLICIPSKYLNLPLHLAASKAYLDEVKLLTTEKSVNHRGYRGQTALFMATCRGHIRIVRWLLAHGANPNLTDDGGWSPLSVSLSAKHFEIAEELLKYDADPNIASNTGRTALHEAAQAGNRSFVERFIERSNSDSLKACNLGVTPFMLAILSGKIEIVDYMTEKGFDGIGGITKTGQTCVHYAAESGKSEMLGHIVSKARDLVMNVDCIGQDVLQYAATGGHSEMVELLRDLGLGSDGLTKGPYTPLSHAIYEGYLEFVLEVIEGADIHRKDPIRGRTPVIGAAAARWPRIFELLVDLGHDLEVLDDFGLSALDYARRDPALWEKIGGLKTKYQEKPLSTRLPGLVSTVKNKIDGITSQVSKTDPLCIYNRLESLIVLLEAFREGNMAFFKEYGRVIYIELANPPDSSPYRVVSSCDMCRVDLRKSSCQRCLQCPAVLCRACYSDYTEEIENHPPRTVPAGLRRLEQLEEELKPLRDIYSTFRGWFWFESTSLFFLQSCDLIASSSAWLDQKLKDYDEWEEKYNSNKRFSSYERPGQQMLKLIEKIRKTIKEVQVLGRDKRYESYRILTEELAEHYQAHKPGKDLRRFICSAHEYMEIPHIDDITETERGLFDSSGMIVNDWFRCAAAAFERLALETRASSTTDRSLVSEDGSLPNARIPIFREEVAMEEQKQLVELSNGVNNTGEATYKENEDASNIIVSATSQDSIANITSPDSPDQPPSTDVIESLTALLAVRDALLTWMSKEFEEYITLQITTYPEQDPQTVVRVYRRLLINMVLAAWRLSKYVCLGIHGVQLPFDITLETFQSESTEAPSPDHPQAEPSIIEIPENSTVDINTLEGPSPETALAYSTSASTSLPEASVQEASITDASVPTTAEL